MRGLGTTLVALLLLGGCGGVFAKNPASEESEGPPDARLVGLWRMEELDEPGAQAGAARDRTILGIGNAPGGRRLQAAVITLSKEGNLDMCVSHFWTTKIKDAPYASLRLEDPARIKKEDEHPWYVVRYRFTDADTVSVLALDEDAVAADVRAGKIAGTAGERKKPGEALVVTLDAPTPELRAYLEARGEAIYATKRPFVMRRMPAK